MAWPRHLTDKRMSKLNSEFNYRYQVIGETVWAKIQTLQGFLGGRKRAAALENVAGLKYQAKLSELEHLKAIGALPHVILNLTAEIIELESFHEVQHESFRQNEDEIACLERLLAEYYAIAEPTRIPGFTDDQMFEANAANEFTAVVGREIQAEIIANGRPSPAKLHNAMSNPFTFKALQDAGLIPREFALGAPNNDPLHVSMTPKNETTHLGDVNYANVSLLLHADGVNNSTTILDNSSVPKIVATVGNAKISTAQSKFGGSSLVFDGVGDSLTVPSSTAFQFGASTPFTIEFWVNFSGYPTSNAGSYASCIIGKDSESLGR